MDVVSNAEFERGLNPEQFVRWMEQCANATLHNFSSLLKIFRCYGKIVDVEELGPEHEASQHPTPEGIQIHVEQWIALLHDAELLRSDRSMDFFMFNLS